MNRSGDFDQTLRAWLRRQAPTQAPDRVVEAALERVANERQRRSWLQRAMGGTRMATLIRVAAVTAVIGIAAMIGFQLSNLTNDVGTTPSPMPSASGEPAESSTPSSSPSVEPSAEPSAAALVLELFGSGEASPLHLVTVLDDGQVISSDPFRVRPPTERRLTAAGIQLLREELDATGLTTTSASYLPIANPGVEPPGFGGSGSVLHVGMAGGDQVTISWYLFSDVDFDYFQPQPEAEALEALSARLTTLEAWLPADAWANASAIPFEPERYFMALDPQPRDPGDPGLVDVASVSWPLEGGIEAFGELSDPPIDDVRYGCLDAADGIAVIDSLDAAGASLGDAAELTRNYILGNGADLQISITVSPILYASTSCP